MLGLQAREMLVKGAEVRVETEEFANLRQHRSGRDAWQTPGWSDRSGNELPLAAIAAGAIVGYAATRRRSDPALWFLITGVIAGAVAITLLGGQQSLGDDRETDDQDVDPVTRESEESFPASDPPSSNATTAQPIVTGSPHQDL